MSENERLVVGGEEGAEKIGVLHGGQLLPQKREVLDQHLHFCLSSVERRDVGDKDSSCFCLECLWRIKNCAVRTTVGCRVRRGDLFHF